MVYARPPLNRAVVPVGGGTGAATADAAGALAASFSIFWNTGLVVNRSSSFANTLFLVFPSPTSSTFLAAKSLTIVAAISGVISANLVRKYISPLVFIPNPVYKSCRVLAPDA